MSTTAGAWLVAALLCWPGEECKPVELQPADAQASWAACRDQRAGLIRWSQLTGVRVSMVACIPGPEGTQLESAG